MGTLFAITRDRLFIFRLFFFSLFFYFFVKYLFLFSLKMDFKLSSFHYADDRKHSKDSMAQKTNENTRKKELPKERDLDKANRDLCPTCPRETASPNSQEPPKCNIEMPADPIRCPPLEGCPPLPRCPACEPLPYKCDRKKPKDPSCPQESGTCGAQQQIGQGIKTKK